MSNAVKLPNGETQTNATPGQHPLNWFEPVAHEWVGSSRKYYPVGFPETAARAFDSTDSVGHLVLGVGMTVVVQSAWDRPWIENAPILLYVSVEETGEYTHVTEADIAGLA